MEENDYSDGLVQMHDLKCLTAYLKLYSKDCLLFLWCFSGFWLKLVDWLNNRGKFWTHDSQTREKDSRQGSVFKFSFASCVNVAKFCFCYNKQNILTLFCIIVDCWRKSLFVILLLITYIFKMAMQRKTNVSKIIYIYIHFQFTIVKS